MRAKSCRVSGTIVVMYSKVRSAVLITVGVLNSKCRCGKVGIGAGVGMDSLPVEASP